MTAVEERDYKKSLARITQLERLMAEVYPDKEFPNGMLSPQVGSWLSKQIVLIERLQEITKAEKTEEVLKEVRMILKRQRIYELWKQCYNENNS